MLDFSFGELFVIGGVALVALGPERLPRVARTVGQWVGKAQSYIADVRSEIDREIHLSELRQLGEEARQNARNIEDSIRGAVTEARTGLNHAASQIQDVATQAMAPPVTGRNAGWIGGASPPPAPMHFSRRYRPRPTIDDVARELERMKRQIALPDVAAGGRNTRFAPRARVNRVRIRR